MIIRRFNSSTDNIFLLHIDKTTNIQIKTALLIISNWSWLLNIQIILFKIWKK